MKCCRGAYDHRLTLRLLLKCNDEPSSGAEKFNDAPSEGIMPGGGGGGAADLEE